MYHKRLRDKEALDPIDYEIFDYSSKASSYDPGNIKTNDPQDPNSRWSTVTNDHRQFLILRVDESVIGTITFGKFSKIHVCNIKEMRISVSYDNKEYVEVFYGGLRNDTEAETFNLTTTVGGKILVTRYLKIEPLAAWGMNFNYSIWYVGLKGILEVGELVERQRESRRREIVKTSLRNLRRYSGYKVQEEESDRIHLLLEKSAFEELEEYILQKEFVERPGYLSEWEEVKKEGAWPCERGGHQMVTVGDRVFLYGGWNGVEELDDLWVYDGIKWVKMGDEDGPGKRSCHKMTSDGRRIYLVGKYVSQPVEGNEVWVCEDGRWSVLKVEGEIPSNTYDHSLCLSNSIIYSFGGKRTADEETYGGLYKLDLKSWSVIREDSLQPTGTPILRGRLGHSMIFIPNDYIPGSRFNNSLGIVGGQRGKENYKEILFYALDTDTVYETIPFPIRTEGRVIQRAILYKEDILVLFTYGTEKLDTFSLWTYSLKHEKWNRVVEKTSISPIPRSAHQLVLCDSSFYLFGGNVMDKRQNDLWRLSLKKTPLEDVRRLARFTVRKYKFLDLLDKKREKEAVDYLRREIKPLNPGKEALEGLCREIFQREDETDPYEEISKLVT